MNLKKLTQAAILLIGLVFNVYAHAAPTEAFLSITDVHFDPFLACHNATPCPLITELENAPASQWHAILTASATDQPAYKQDANFVLVESAIAAAKQAANVSHPQFVIVLGDLLAHSYLAKFQTYSIDKSAAAYQNFVKKTQEFLAGEFAQAFPDTDVYLALGNNDSYQGDYVSDVKGAFFKDDADIWSALIKNPYNRHTMQFDFPYAGYYAVTMPALHNLHLIILNTNLFSAKAQGTNVQAAAEAELNWLHQELSQAASQHQQVIIAMHIPAGIDIYGSMQASQIIDFWQPAYTQRYLAELNAFAGTVIGILPAHLHSDFFQVYTAANHQQIPIIATPSISPVNGNNPAFKIFQIDTMNMQIADFSVIYTALTPDMNWLQEYDFNQVYQPNCKNCTVLTGLQLLGPHPSDTVTDYQNFYDTGTHISKVMTNYFPYYWCQVKAISHADYQTCLTALTN